MKNGKLVRATAMFFALMLCFTILSRAADQLSVAAVTTERPQNRMIEHTVRTSGKIVQNQELAVTTLPDQRVTAIYVREGQRVEKGDLLFEVDTALLEEKILDQQLEMEKQELQVKDAKSQKEVSAQQKANSQAQAAEQYSLSTRQAGVQLSRAKQQLDQAKEKLKKFRESAKSEETGEAGGTDSEVEEALLQALEEKTDAYVAAQGELRTLEWEIENAVYTAKQNAANGMTATAALTAEDRVFTGAAEEEYSSVDIQIENDDETPAEIMDESGSDSLDVVLDESEDLGMDGGLSGDGSEGDFEFDIEVEDVTSSDTGIGGESNSDVGDRNDSGLDLGAETMGDLDSNEGNEIAPDFSADDMIVDDASAQTASQPVTPEELARIEQTVRADYSQRLEEAQQKAADAQSEKEAAEAALVKYQQEQLAADHSENTQTARQLAADVQAAQQAYEDAALAANEAAVTSGRAVATANIADPSNSSDRMSEITYEQMELTLAKLEGLKEARGKVRAEADGQITKINIMTGEKTTDTTALLMADLSKGYRFTADITKEQQKYIGTGDLVRLSSGDGKTRLEDLPVESVTADENDEGIYHVTVQIPENTQSVS